MKNNEQLEGARQAKKILFSPPPPPSRSPPPHFSPNILFTKACWFARPLFARLFDLRQEKKRKRLLRRLPRKRMGGRKVGPTDD